MKFSHILLILSLFIQFACLPNGGKGNKNRNEDKTILEKPKKDSNPESTTKRKEKVRKRHSTLDEAKKRLTQLERSKKNNEIQLKAIESSIKTTSNEIQELNTLLDSIQAEINSREEPQIESKNYVYGRRNQIQHDTAYSETTISNLVAKFESISSTLKELNSKLKSQEKRKSATLEEATSIQAAIFVSEIEVDSLENEGTIKKGVEQSIRNMDDATKKEFLTKINIEKLFQKYTTTSDIDETTQFFSEDQLFQIGKFSSTNSPNFQQSADSYFDAMHQFSVNRATLLLSKFPEESSEQLESILTNYDSIAKNSQTTVRSFIWYVSIISILFDANEETKELVFTCEENLLPLQIRSNVCSNRKMQVYENRITFLEDNLKPLVDSREVHRIKLINLLIEMDNESESTVKTLKLEIENIEETKSLDEEAEDLDYFYEFSDQKLIQFQDSLNELTKKWKIAFQNYAAEHFKNYQTKLEFFRVISEKGDLLGLVFPYAIQTKLAFIQKTKFKSVASEFFNETNEETISEELTETPEDHPSLPTAIQNPIIPPEQEEIEKPQESIKPREPQRPQGIVSIRPAPYVEPRERPSENDDQNPETDVTSPDIEAEQKNQMREILEVQSDFELAELLSYQSLNCGELNQKLGVVSADLLVLEEAGKCMNDEYWETDTETAQGDLQICSETAKDLYRILNKLILEKQCG